MGALAPVSSWISEDDLLLKNAIEAGASLESLAKGAVQFSRKFSVQELRERWHALLYDPVVSAEAAFHMIEIERSAPTVPSRCSRTGNSKENKGVSGKRKLGSVRSCYFLRKRNCSEPLNSVDTSFLVGPNNGYCIGNDEGPFFSNNFVLEESNLDIMHLSFPRVVDDSTAHAFRSEFESTVQDVYPMEQDNMSEEIPHIHGENLLHTEELQVHSDPVLDCSMFDGSQIFSSPIPECGASFHDLEYSTQPPDMPLWGTVEGIAEPGIPVELGPCENDLHTSDSFSLHHDGGIQDACPSRYAVVPADSCSKGEIPSNNGQKDATGAEEDFLAEVTNSLLNFMDDEEMDMDVDGKDVSSISYYDHLSSLLLNSPNDDNLDDMPNILEEESSVAPDNLMNQSAAFPGVLEEDTGSHCSVDAVCDSELTVLTSASFSNSQFPELIDGVICCTLNTEDPEIPCNDDVVFASLLRPRISSTAQWPFRDPGKPNSLSSNKKNSEGGSVLMHSDPEKPGTFLASSRSMQEIDLPLPVNDHRFKFDFPSSDNTLKGGGCANTDLIRVSSAGTETLGPGKLKEETTEASLVKHLDHNSSFSCDGYNTLANTNCVKHELDVSAIIQNQATSGSIDITGSEQIVNPSISDAEELYIESDDDVPYFSDIEAMILDMDLDPEDQDLCCREKVANYQHEDTRRAIMRLEQGAHSYMQRAISRHGAFAIIYGRQLKHFIKKPEVLLGRATEDVMVDIDLGRERRGSKISRRQASISLDKSGSFHLKNLGKCSISVNDKDLAPGQTLGLTSSCLIEIRGMPFIFEANQSCVEQYLESIRHNNQAKQQQD